ncbi:hypothetical protein MHU86_12001 [Fragilaria crotonensis]|nr:hypothetical protein MHU86_12001 [Fragilaria crotonensis]
MKKAKRPPSFDASPGAVPIHGSRPSHGLGSLRSPAELLQEPSSLHEEECKEEVGTDVKRNGFSNLAAVNSSEAPEVGDVQGQENLPVGTPIYAELDTPYTPQTQGSCMNDHCVEH